MRTYKLVVTETELELILDRLNADPRAQIVRAALQAQRIEIDAAVPTHGRHSLAAS